MPWMRTNYPVIDDVPVLIGTRETRAATLVKMAVLIRGRIFISVSTNTFDPRKSRIRNRGKHSMNRARGLCWKLGREWAGWPI